MVHQPLANPRHVCHDIDPEIAQVRGRPDPGTQQMGRRMDRARRDDDLTAAKFGFPALEQRLDADAARPLKQELLDLGQGGNRQIAAQPGGGIEIADRRRDPAVVEV